MRLNLAIFALVIGLTAWATYAMQMATPQPEIKVVPSKQEVTELKDAPAVPSFEFTTLKGKTHKIESFKGKTIILNFWATWCAPCIAEFPKLLQLAQRENTVLIALSVDNDKAKIEPFLKKLNQKHLNNKNVYIAHDPEWAVVQDKFQSYMLPETILIDPQMRMREKIAGANWELEDLEKIMAGF